MFAVRAVSGSRPMHNRTSWRSTIDVMAVFSITLQLFVYFMLLLYLHVAFLGT